MSEFNGRKFYGGWSVHNDPALSTSARNFEFKFTRSENLDRLIHKVHQTDDKPKKREIQSKVSKKKHHSEAIGAFRSRDIDVETEMSRQEANKVRPLSDNEIDILIGKARSSTKMPALASDHSSENSPLALSGARSESNDNGNLSRCQGGSSGKNQSATELEAIIEDIPDEEIEPKEWGFAKIEGYNMPTPQWVDVVDTARAHAAIIENTSRDYKFSELSDDMGMRHYIPGVMTDGEMPSGSMTIDSLALQQVQMSQPVYYVDSDLEYEMMGRAEYEKYCTPRPSPDELPSTSNDSGGFAEFIEMEPQMPNMDLSFLKNSSPMRYSDMTDEDQLQRNDEAKIKVFIKGPNNTITTKSSPTKASKAAESKKPHKELKKKLTKTKGRTNTQPTKDRTPSPRAKISKYMENARNAAPRTPRNHRTKIKGTRVAQNDRSFKTLTMSKSIEELKLEKIQIFTKMTSTQERIIQLLDKLRVNLLEMYVPDNTFEKTKRQRNAFEFSVRFSRNFLYPLKGMIEDLKQTTVEQLNSASSNDACARVGAIYSLIYQSLQTYQKQLRFFLLDQVPQKLTTLIEMIFGATNISLDKAIFDRNDAIIDCLQERCTKFLIFLEDMHEERFLTARENFRKMNSEKSHSNYNLKMFMNDLNMYEPKLVPKNPPPHSRRQRSHRKSVQSPPVKKPAVGCPIEGSSEMIMTHIPEDTISTQIEIEKDHDNFSSGIIHSVQSILSSDALKARKLESGGHLNKAIMDALQTVTKEQVRQVLEPLIHSLGTAIDKKNDSETIDSILNDFRSKLYALTQKEKYKKSQLENSNEIPLDDGQESICVGGSEVFTSTIAENASNASEAAKQTEKTIQHHQRAAHETTTPSTRSADNGNDNDDDDCDDDDDDDDDDANKESNEHGNYNKGEGNKNDSKSNSNSNSDGNSDGNGNEEAYEKAGETTASPSSVGSPPNSFTAYTPVSAWALRSKHSGTDTETTDPESGVEHYNVDNFNVVVSSSKKLDEQKQETPKQKLEVQKQSKKQPQPLLDRLSNQSKQWKQPELPLPLYKLKQPPKKQPLPVPVLTTERRAQQRKLLQEQRLELQQQQQQQLQQRVAARRGVRKSLVTAAATVAAGGVKGPPFKPTLCSAPSVAQSRAMLRKMPTSASSMLTSAEMPRTHVPRPHGPPSRNRTIAVKKPRVHRKRRNPLLPPPPVPSGTPTTSARRRDGYASAEEPLTSTNASDELSMRNNIDMTPILSPGLSEWTSAVLSASTSAKTTTNASDGLSMRNNIDMTPKLSPGLSEWTSAEMSVGTSAKTSTNASDGLSVRNNINMTPTLSPGLSEWTSAGKSARTGATASDRLSMKNNIDMTPTLSPGPSEWTSGIVSGRTSAKTTANASDRLSMRNNIDMTPKLSPGLSECTSAGMSGRTSAWQSARPSATSTGRSSSYHLHAVPRSVGNPKRMASVSALTAAVPLTAISPRPAVRRSASVAVSNVTSSISSQSPQTEHTYMNGHYMPREVPLTHAFDLVDNEMDINRLNQRQNRCVADILNKCFIKGEINQQNSAKINNVLNVALKDMTQNALPLPLPLNSSPYESDWQPTAQQQLHEQQLKRNQLQQERDEEHRKRHEKFLLEHQDVFVDLEPHLSRHPPSAGGDNNAETPQDKESKLNQDYQPEKECNTSKDLDLDELIKDREAHLNACTNNRFYYNPHYGAPWEVFTIIAHKLTNEVVSSIEQDFNAGVSRFVDDFLDGESKS